MRQVHASICVDLPEGPFTEAVALVKVQPIWDTFLTALVDAEVAHTFKIEILET